MSLSARDRRLLDGAASGLSANELAESVGLPAERCKLRIDELLSERDVYTEIQQRQLYMHELNTLKDQMKSQIDEYGLDTKSATVLLQVLRTIGEVVTQSEEVAAQQLKVITETQAWAMIQLFSAATERAKSILRADYPNVDVLVIEQAITEGLRDRMKGLVTYED